MKLKEKTNDITQKIAKGFVGIFAIKLILFLGALAFQACTTEDNSEAETQNEAFAKALELTRFNLLQHVSLTHTKGLNSKEDPKSTFIYLVKQNNQKLTTTDFVNSIDNLESLVNVVNTYGFSVRTTSKVQDISKDDLNSEDPLVIDGPSQEEETIGAYTAEELDAIQSLEPSVIEARNYLQGKGFTSQEIDQMIVDEQGIEQDLVPLVMTMTELENSGQASSNDSHLTSISQLFFNTAFAQEDSAASEIGTCAAIATGADVLWALGTSNASSWTKGAMKRAFGTIAKKAMGPVGVAIAVVSFGLCLIQD
jgi:hypothetical protein